MRRVYDAPGLIAYLQDEPGAAEMDRLLLDSSAESYVHAVNLCEVFYDTLRRGGKSRAQGAIRALAAAGIETRTDLDEEFWQGVGRLKADPPRKSLADCFCIALARRLGAEVVTADHHEFDALVQLNLVPIRFIR